MTAAGDLTAEQLAALEEEGALDGTPWWSRVDKPDDEARQGLIDLWQSYAMSAMQGGADADTAAMDADVMMVEHMTRDIGIAAPAGIIPWAMEEEPPPGPDAPPPPADPNAQVRH